MTKQNTPVATNKNLILNLISDYAGQGTIRNLWPFQVINSIYGQKQQLINNWLHFFPDNPNVLAQAKAIYFQRQMSPQQLMAVQHYKMKQSDFKYKMVWDMDDMVWGFNELQGGSKEEGIPSYNGSWSNITTEMKNSSVEIMRLMDVCILSTQYLADYVEREFGITNTVVVPNTVPKAYWGYHNRTPITSAITKPRIAYTGSPTHYDNKKKLLGDWDNSWKDYIVNKIKSDEIEFTVYGGLPWFLEDVKDLITIKPWVPIFALHHEIKNGNHDFCINPLVRNDFNYGKSDLKLVESAAAGMACIGTVFTNNKPSPYDHSFITAPDNITEDGIDKLIKKFSKPKAFNEVIAKQTDWIESEGRWTESPKYINRFVKILTEPVV
tara:strand:+ start:9430 stop:10572 length:1143 start_codon:yes stop_codon:yes gene_type:complete